MSNTIKIEQISANGYTFKCRTCGLENNGDLVVFLHGFPESSIIWCKPMQILADKGYRCIAPDQRGYSEGARPLGAENYTTRELCKDVLALADAMGNRGKFHLVGHDWGAGVGWAMAALYSDRLFGYVSMSTPHSGAFLDAMKNDPAQTAKSHYIFEFTKPELPEASLAADDYARLRGYWAGFPQEIIDDYLKIFSVKEARTATVNWYRGLFLPTDDRTNPPVPYGDMFIPITYIFGVEDLANARAGVDATHKFIKGPYTFIQLKTAGHWLMQFNEDECTKEIVEHVLKYTKK